MDKKQNPRGMPDMHKDARKKNKIHDKNKIKQPEENDPHARDMDDGNGEVLGGKI